jgi:HEPN domain-containing protein
MTAIQIGQIHHMLGELEGRLTEELGVHLFLAVPPELVPFYEQSEPIFGQDVATKFQSLQYEIAEAGKCYALGRSTASAFHSIRCLEAGITALSRCLGIPDPTKGSQRSWMKLLNAIKDKLDAKWTTAASRFSGDGQFFEEAYATLAAIQNPYRNATMHLDSKYTEEEARDLLQAVRRFMKKIAVRMDENGDPKA